jgi:hypothetical protein
MEQEFRKWDEGMIVYKTHYNKRRVEDMQEKLNNYNADIAITERTDGQKCKVCHYINDGFAFQAFTDTYCGICGKKMTFPTSNTDKLCIDCAKIHGLCKHCGGRMD